MAWIPDSHSNSNILWCGMTVGFYLSIIIVSDGMAFGLTLWEIEIVDFGMTKKSCHPKHQLDAVS